ncbi:hypothetical protein CFP56_040859 [Quercus suber]|uniref:Uncharacterized protein n=1 Tax=Quercus suber TaxID=58331 RepID=A0AAW0IXZ9_QUESU
MKNEFDFWLQKASSLINKVRTRFVDDDSIYESFLVLLISYQLINKVRTRFADDDSIYESFLVLLISYHNGKGKGQQDMGSLCYQIHDLFKDHPDLFQEFFSFVSNSVPNETTTNKSCSFDLQALSQQGNSLFKKIQSCLRGSDYHYNYFLERIHCYTSGHIGLDSVLGSCPLGFVDELHSFIKCCENLGGFPAPATGVLCESSLGSGQKKRKGSHLSIGCGIGDEVKSSRKGQQWQNKKQKVCEDFEDLKYDRDRLLTPIRSTIECAERLMNEIQGKSLEEPIIVEDYYFNTKHIKCIETHCNVKGDELRENPRRGHTLELDIAFSTLSSGKEF